MALNTFEIKVWKDCEICPIQTKAIWIDDYGRVAFACKKEHAQAAIDKKKRWASDEQRAVA